MVGHAFLAILVICFTISSSYAVRHTTNQSLYRDLQVAIHLKGSLPIQEGLKEDLKEDVRVDPLRADMAAAVALLQEPHTMPKHTEISFREPSKTKDSRVSTLQIIR